jgi:CheY-like chemotaxis protein
VTSAPTVRLDANVAGANHAIPLDLEELDMANLSHLSHVLVLEDEPLILFDLESTLSDAGVAQITSTISVGEALDALAAGRFDAAVLDLHLGRSGWSYDVARRLQELGIPFIFTSGTVDVADGFRTVPLVTKPFSSDQLLAALLQVSSDLRSQAAQ